MELIFVGVAIGTLFGWLAWKAAEGAGFLPGLGFTRRHIRQLAVDTLNQEPKLFPSSNPVLLSGMVRDGFEIDFVVDAQARTVLRVALNPAEAPDIDDLVLPLHWPVYAGNLVLEWVDPKDPLRHLEWCLDLVHAASGTGLWGQIAAQYEMYAGRMVSGHPYLKGRVCGRELSIVQSAEGLSLVTSIPSTLRAVLGTGSSGNPVVDLLLDTQDIPPNAHEAVLVLVHGLGATLQDGELKLLHLGPLGAVWPSLFTLLDELRILRSGLDS
ncbi:MAG: hypothetical protein ACI9VR_003460 [Cognaticolwellia sp.]|jgi:hypothetical protein